MHAMKAAPETEFIKSVHRQCRAGVDALLAEYGATTEHLEIRHWEKLDRILDAPSVGEAERLAKAAKDSVFISLLVLMSKGKILGRNPKAAYEKKARASESRARMFDKKAESKFSSPEEVERFKKRAVKEREKALELWKLAGVEPPKPEELVLSDEELKEAEAEVQKVEKVVKVAKAKVKEKTKEKAKATLKTSRRPKKQK